MPYPTRLGSPRTSPAGAGLLRLLFLLSLASPLAGCGDESSADPAQDAGDVADAGPDDADADTGPGCFVLSDGRCVEETFRNPPTLEPSADGTYELELAATEVTLDGQRHCVRAYNGAVPGPTIDTPAREAGSARQVRVNLANRLSGRAFRSLQGGACTCRTAAGAECSPAHSHNACHSGGHDMGCTCVDDEGEPCEHMFDFNVTNLHAHGAHARPDYSRGGDDCVRFERDGVTFACRECGDDVCDGDTGDDTCYHADNVLNAVATGRGAQYRWDIDEDHTHHEGLQCYHPHIHGTTAIQVASGAAGAWIVRGDLDELPGIVDARERVMVFWTPPIGDGAFEPLEDGVACSDETLTFDDFSTLGDTRALQANFINDQRRPRLVTAPGQVERWRILHAGFLDEVYLGLFRGDDSDCSSFSTAADDTLQLTQIGRDGLIMPQSFEYDYVFMAPGYRVEAMLGGEGALADGETWCLVAARFLQDTEEGDHGRFGGQPMAPPVEPELSDIITRFATDGDVVAIVNVAESAGPATTTTLPDYDAIAALAPEMDLEGVPIAQRCAEAAAINAAADIDQAAILQVGAATVDDPDPCGCANYNVNCRNFEEADRERYPVDRDLPLGAVEHWRVQASLDGHPFHIHINPMIVCPSDNPFDPMPFPHWRDTYLVNLDRRIDAIVRNESYTGSYVFHCHKLTHEDEGMMQLIRACDPETDPT
jgi:L-ascorbate oxidase